MKITNEYMEWYALLSLIYCYDKTLVVLRESKAEAPDWQSEALDIGLEVTEALQADDGRIRNVMNKYFGKGLDGQLIKDQIDKKYPEYSHKVGVIGNTAYMSLSGDMISKLERIAFSITIKTKKLNDHYHQFAHNWLYVFAPDLFQDFDIPKVYQLYKRATKQYPVKFDKIFIYNRFDKIFVVNQDGKVTKISIPDDCLELLKREAQQKSCI